ncbi:MAG: hypothetical protein HY909_07755 [Deltaproteobacteria bacterium]|nr:hypothetical protein [Deltaproteobacteria bacterium]
MTLLEGEEERWFEDRQDWWARHALRAGADGGLVPFVFFRRQGEYLECSWDNHRFPPARKGVQFVDREGVEFVDVEVAAAVVSDFLREVTARITARVGQFSMQSESSDEQDPWRWLLPPHVLREIASQPRLRARIARKTRDGRHAFLATHSAETQLLAALPPSISPATILKVLGEDVAPDRGGRLLALRRPSKPSVTGPWEAGYDAALATRRALGLLDAPVGNIKKLLAESIDVEATAVSIGSAIDGGRAWLGKGSPRVFRNSRSSLGRTESFAFARELGHLVMDPAPEGEVAGLSTAWESWPISARAKAFAVMFLMPEGALKARRSLTKVDGASLTVLAEEFGLTPVTAAWHLRNLQIISEDQRLALLGRVT